MYFLFGSALIVTVAVCIAYMPETKGQDLESIRDAFGKHRASEMPAVRWLKRLGRGVAMKVGNGRRVEGIEMGVVGERRI